MKFVSQGGVWLVLIVALGLVTYRLVTARDDTISLVFHIPDNAKGFFVVPFQKSDKGIVHVNVPKSGVASPVGSAHNLEFKQAQFASGQLIPFEQSISGRKLDPNTVQLFWPQTVHPEYPDAMLFYVGTEKEYARDLVSLKLGLVVPASN